LRGEAHSLKPIVQVGKNGVNPAALREIEEALKAHGLIKVRFVSGQATRREMGQQIAAALGCGLVGIVGHVASFYRPQDETAEG
jgi:RNA-binding protein